MESNPNLTPQQQQANFYEAAAIFQNEGETGIRRWLNEKFQYDFTKADDVKDADRIIKKLAEAAQPVNRLGGTALNAVSGAEHASERTPQSDVIQPDANGEFPTPADGAVWMLVTHGIPQTVLCGIDWQHVTEERRGKSPILPGWQHPENLLRTPEAIRAAAAKYQGCNFGSVFTNDAFAFEADAPPEGAPTIRERFEAVGGKFTSVLLIKSSTQGGTDRGHRYYKWIEGVQNIGQGVKNTKFGDFSLRVKGQQCVSPGSVHPRTRQQYKVVSTGLLAPPSAQEIAFWNSEKLSGAAPASTTAASTGGSRQFPNFKVGDVLGEGEGRNTALSEFAFHLWTEVGCTEEELRNKVYEANSSFQPPLRSDEVEPLIARKLKFPPKMTLNQQPDPGSPADLAEQAKTRLNEWLDAPKDSPVKLSSVDAIVLAAKLNDGDYEDVRVRTAKKLGWRPKALDAARAKARAAITAAEKEDNLQGKPLDVVEVEPWQEPVNIADVLNEIEKTLNRFIYFQREEDASVTTLWCAMTWLAGLLQIAPYLGIRSPEKGCGKSTLLEIIKYLVFRPLSFINCTAAAVFRMLDMQAMTLLIDELDSFLRYDSDFPNLLNAGHSRKHCHVIRCVGEDLIPRQFNVFGPKAYGMIGDIKDTIESRSLTVILFSKVEEDKVEDWNIIDYPEIESALQTLSRKLARWAANNAQAVVQIKPDLRGVTNRKRDNWRPLLQIAEFAGQGWAEKARAAAGLTDVVAAEKSESRQFIEDVRNIFYTRNVDFLPSDALLADLHMQQESGWKHYGNGKDGLTQRDLARFLKQYGIKSGKGGYRGMAGDARVRGYHVSQFANIFNRFLRNTPPEKVDIDVRKSTDPNTADLNAPAKPFGGASGAGR